MKNRKFERKEPLITCCGTHLALYSNRHGMLREKSPWPNKRMHRQGGGRGEFEKNSGKEKLLNQRVAARKVDLVPEDTSNCLSTG